MYVKSFIFTLLLFLASTVVNAQTYVYSYTDPCTGMLKTINVPTNGVTVTYFGQMNTFAPADFTNGTFNNWANSVYSSFGGNNPCGSTIGVSSSISMAQNSAMNALGIFNSLSALSDIASASGGLNTNGVTESSKTESKKNEKKNNSGSNVDANVNPSSNSNINTNNTSNTTYSGLNTTGNNSGNNSSSNSNQSNSNSQSNGSTTGSNSSSNNNTSTNNSSNSNSSSSANNSSSSSTNGANSNGSSSSSSANNSGSSSSTNGTNSNGGSTNSSSSTNGANSNGSSTNNSSSTSNSSNPGYTSASTNNSNSSSSSSTNSGTSGNNSSSNSGSGNGSESGNNGSGSGSVSGSGNSNNTPNNNTTGTDAATNEEKKSSNILGGSVTSIQNATSTNTNSSKGGSATGKGQAPTIVLSSDFAGFNFKQGDVSYGGKGTAGWTSLNWDGSRSHGFMLDYTSANKGPNFTAFFATIKKRRINLISATGTTSFYGKGSLYGTIAVGQMWSFPKVKNLKAIYMATSSYGNVYGTKFLGTAFIAGGMYDMKLGKRTQVKFTNLFIYAPYISYYNDMVLKSPYVIMPIIGTNIGVTKKFKLNVNFGGTYALGENVLNFTVMMGTRFAL